MEKNKHIYDTGYKKLFENPDFMTLLLKSFIPMNWVSKVDFKHLEPINTTFIRDDYKKKESDVIYRIHLNDGIYYLYLLLEFQSTVDRDMPLRFLSYYADCQEYLRNHEKSYKTKGISERYPFIFPILIYNGDDKWTVPDNIKDCVQLPDNELEPYVPSLKYFKIIINEFSKESLIKMRNILAMVFLTENLENSEEMLKYSEQMVEIISEEVNPKLIEGFEIWFKHLVSAHKIPNFIDFSKIKKEEAKTMFATTIENIKKEGKKEGKIETAKKMREEGMTLSLISKITGLSEAELNKILKD